MARRERERAPRILLALALASLAGCSQSPRAAPPAGGARQATAATAQPGGEAPDPACLDVIIRGGTVYDGTGAPGRPADVGVCGDRVARVGDLSAAHARRARWTRAGSPSRPGFINMLSWATESLIADGRSQSDIRQGVTLEVFGEGWSMGPLNDAMKKQMLERAGRHQLRHRLDDARRVPRAPGAARRLAQRRLVRRRDDGAHPRARLRRPRADRPRSSSACSALVRQAMDGGRARRRLVADLRARPSTPKTDELVALCERRRASTAACTSRTCAARATACSRRSTS